MILPGIGAFISSFRPALIDSEECKITPPAAIITFNRAVTSDDGLITNSISRKEEISFEEARMILAKELAGIKQKILQGENVSLGRLGELQPNEEKNPVFVPAGFPESEHFRNTFPEVSLVKKENREAEEEVNNRSNLELGKDTDSTTPRQFKYDFEPEKYYYFRISKLFAKAVAMFVIVLLIGAAYIMSPENPQSGEQRASVMPVEALMHKTVTSAAPTPKNMKDSIQTSEPKEELKAYYLIVATFNTEKEAQKFVDINSSEENPLFIVSNSRLARVAVAEANQKDSLRTKLNSRDIRERFPNSWIWERD